MKRKFILTILCILSLSGIAQINYSPIIPSQQLSVLKQLEKKLRNTAFTLPKSISDTAKLNYADSLKYAEIFNTFFDTTQIKFLKENQTSYMKKEEEGWQKGMTINCIVSIHNLINCVPDSLFFVMPVNEYNLIEKDDGRTQYAQANLLVAGYKGGGFYYPFTSILFSLSNQKITYMSFLIQFEQDSDIKNRNFEEKLQKAIAPCIRILSEDYGDNHSYKN